MAKILVDERMLQLIPDFIQQVERIVGEVLIVDSLAYGVKELLFSFKKFDQNEIVLARIQKRKTDKHFKVIYIISTKTYFRHTNFNNYV